jgi:hypothetical protein
MIATKAQALLDELFSQRDKLTRFKFNAILRGETDIASCPECVEQKKKFDELYRRAVKGSNQEHSTC